MLPFDPPVTVRSYPPSWWLIHEETLWAEVGEVPEDWLAQMVRADPDPAGWIQLLSRTLRQLIRFHPHSPTMSD